MCVLTRHRAVGSSPAVSARAPTGRVLVEGGAVVAVRRTRALVRRRRTLAVTQPVLTTPARTAATLRTRRTLRVRLRSRVIPRRSVVTHEVRGF